MSARVSWGRRGFFLTAAALLLTGGAGGADPPASQVKLAPTFLEGKEPFYQEVTTVTKQDMVVMRMKHQQEQTHTLYLRWTPKGKKGGKYVVVQKILGMKMDINIAGVPQQPKNPMAEMFKQFEGAEFTLTIGKDKDGRYTVESVQGMNDLITKIGQSNQAMLPLLQKILTESMFKQMAEPMLGVIPPHGIVPADKSWSSTNKLDAGAIGSYTTRNKYTYAGQDNGVAQIKVKTELAYTAPLGNNQGVLPFRIVKANLKGKPTAGTIQFNLKKGRIESADLKTHLEGSLLINIVNMNTAVELSQTQVIRLRTTDTNPLAAKK